jgi:sterol desaturase/sphingolipid hydroxylase (fatty acid hydroxylase superfamily)
MKLDLISQFIANQFPAGSKLNWRWFLVTLIFMSVYYSIQRLRSKIPKNEKFWHYWTPKNIWTNKSTHVDISLCLFYYLIFYPIFWPLGSKYGGLIRDFLGNSLTLIHDGHWFEQTLIIKLSYGLFMFLAWDFALFFNHVLHHKFTFLWRFHKIHHSAETLNVFTSFRFHPLEQFLEMMWVFTLLSIVNSVFSWITIGEAGFLLFWNKNIYFVIPFIYANLIHHHQNISFGFFDRVLISPAYHKLHHLTDSRFHNKNFGMFISLWDRLHKSQKIPDGDMGSNVIGLGEEKYRQNVFSLFIKPLKKNT